MFKTFEISEKQLPAILNVWFGTFVATATIAPFEPRRTLRGFERALGKKTF